MAAIAAVAIAPGLVAADSAVATAGDPELILSYSFNQADEASARQDAIARCLDAGGADCSVLLSCTDPGYGSISIYTEGIGAEIQSVGAVCGVGDLPTATREARRRCEYQLAVDRAGLSVPFEDTNFEMVRGLLARNCGGLGNCQCTERFQWRDDR